MTNDERLMFAEIAELRRQLAIAVEALGKYADRHSWSSCSTSIDFRWFGPKDVRGCHGWEPAEHALDAIQKKGGAS